MSTGFKTATVASADVPATQTNFPVYIDLSRLGITTQADADSVRVYADSSKTTEWAREIVSATEMHVKVPSLTSTTAIYVYWDGTSADYAVTDTYGRNAVWSAFRSIHHLESSGGDSTGNLNNTDVGLSYSAGKVGNDATFSNGSNSRVTTTTGSTSVGTYTYFAWFKSTSTNNRGIVTWTNTGGDTSSGYQININLTSSGTLNVTSGPTTSGTYNDNAWHRVAVTGNGPGNAGVIYVDGASAASGGCFNFGATTIYEMIGRCAGASKTSFDGMLGETRWWVGSLLSANWITTEYNNQSDEAGFWGTWSNVGGTTNTTDFFLMM